MASQTKPVKHVTIFGDPTKRLTMDLICMAEKVGLLATVIPCDSRVHPEASYANNQWTYVGPKGSIHGLGRTAAYRALARYHHGR